MVVMGDYFYVNDMRLKPQPSQITLFHAVMTPFRPRAGRTTHPERRHPSRIRHRSSR